MSNDDSINILLVDDRPENLVSLEAVLDASGYTFVRASSGDEALRHILATDFAVVLLDVRMPGLSGFEVAKLVRARSRSAHTPIIFLTAGDSDQFPVDEAYALGAVDYLVKPVSAPALRAKVGVFVELFRRTREARRAERALAEETAREHQELWRMTLASIGDAVIATGIDGRVTFLNPVAEGLTGWTLDAARGQPLTDVFRIVNESTRAHVDNPALRALETGAIVGLANHTILIARDGTEYPIDDSAAPIRDGRGAVSGAVLVFRDITERKRAEEAQVRLAAIVESSNDAIIGKTTEGVIQTWNAGAERVFGYTAEEAVGRSIRMLLPPERVHEEDEILARIRRGERIEHFETVRVRKGGERVDISVSISPIRDSHGDIVGASKTARDVTAMKRAERVLAESRRRSDAALQAGEVGTYYWDVAADLVTGDRNFVALFGVLSADRPAAPIAEFVAAIHPADRTRVGEEIGRTLRDGVQFRSEYRVVGPAGERWVLARGSVERDPEGRPVGWSGVLVDVTDRKNAEAAVRASEARFRSLFESMDEGYCVVEPVFDDAGRPVDYRYLLVNPALEHHTGLRDIVGKTAREVMPGHETHWIEGYARVARTGETLRRTDRVEALDRWFDVSAFRVDGPASNRVGVLFSDITDRKRAERLLREKDERLQLLLNSASDYAVLILDREGRVLDWLGGAESATGFTADEMRGEPADLLFTPEDRAAGMPAAEMRRAAETGRAEDKRWHQRKDGSQFFADGVMVALRDGKELRGFGKVFRDVTAQKRAADAVQFLSHASASLAELVDYHSTLGRIANVATEGFADWCVVDIFDENGARQRLAVTAKEARDVTAARADDEAFRTAEAAGGIIPHVLKTGESEMVPDLTAIDPDTAKQGPERVRRLREMGVVSYLCVPLTSRGRIIGGMTFLSTSARRRFGPAELDVAQSLTERVTVAIENAQLYRTLQEQDRRKDEFLATLAHELRNPLAPVRNGVQILRTAVAQEPRVTRTLGMMERQLGQMVHIVDDLMDVSRVSSGKVVLRRERIPLRAAVDAAVETSRQMIEAAKHELVVELPEEPLVLDADQTRLVQVLANLLNNAAKYTPHGGRITLSARQEGGEAVVRVADTGVGIPAEMLPKVFEMFTQVGTSLERAQGGLGIGLTLVRRLVEMHGGAVRAESPGAGRGSTFTIRLPLSEGITEPDEPSGDGGASRARQTALTILVVDDNRDAAESLEVLLEMRGHRVRVAHDGPEALRLLATYRPQLIFLDLGLPGMSGYEIARRIRESAELGGVRLVALTGWGQEEDRRRTKEAGFDHHLVKPADLAEVDRILEGGRPRN